MASVGSPTEKRIPSSELTIYVPECAMGCFSVERENNQLRKLELQPEAVV
jgi:hypothetical protein